MKKRPTTATNWKELVALGAAYGEGEDAVKERAKSLGKPFKSMTEDDWKRLAARIVEAHKDEGGKEEPPPDDEDLPF